MTPPVPAVRRAQAGRKGEPLALIDYYRGLLREAFGGSSVILLSGAMQPDLVRTARELGCSGMFALGNRPDPGADAYARFDSPDWREQLDRFDPEHTALAMGDGFRTSGRIAGRRFVGPRPTEWARYEDKTELGALLVAAAVPCAPEVVVPASEVDMLDAASELDVGLGTVWSGDHRDGEQNGGKHVRWVRTGPQSSVAVAHFASQCDRVRVMPFLEGQACSVHGLVTGTGIATLRPVALDVRADPSRGMFEYLGADIDWTPASDAGDEIRRAARGIGEALRGAVDYRGAFCVDGVLTNEGFRPTEVNTRCGLSLTYLARRMPELPLRFLHAFIADGHPADWKPEELEDLVRRRLA